MSDFTALALVLFVYVTFWFIISILKKRNDVADVAWGLGFVLLSWVSLLIADSVSFRGLLVCVLVSMWGLRLAWHIYTRNKGKGEDYRYLAWRQEWGVWFYFRSYAQVYLLQGALLFLVVSPILLINKGAGEIPFDTRDLLGVAIWIIGFTFEVVGDAQLARFIKNPANKGKLMQSGLWAYTRHPNYFGEVTQWWGLWLVALSVPYGFWGIIGPITITILLLKVSGIPLLEKKMVEHPEFVDYKKRVSIFFPMFPKK
ncbi:MAG: DUF1295 domain-containing protein [Candidatus Moranbacteria bacterium]|nr:DUF1295 domain-containing protein [Candidatus Moranbacteria bacterium]